jgi:hypothetical protein
MKLNDGSSICDDVGMVSGLIFVVFIFGWFFYMLLLYLFIIHVLLFFVIIRRIEEEI